VQKGLNGIAEWLGKKDREIRCYSLFRNGFKDFWDRIPMISGSHRHYCLLFSLFLAVSGLTFCI